MTSDQIIAAAIQRALTATSNVFDERGLDRETRELLLAAIGKLDTAKKRLTRTWRDAAAHDDCDVFNAVEEM